MPSVFSKIVSGQITADMVYEDALTMAFLDHAPIEEGHTLVIPKQEIARFDDLPPETLHALMATCQKVARGVCQALETPHYNLSLNNGAPAGQVVFHVHFHIIPRHQGQPRTYTRRPVTKPRMAEIAAAIAAAISRD